MQEIGWLEGTLHEILVAYQDRNIYIHKTYPLAAGQPRNCDDYRTVLVKVAGINGCEVETPSRTELAQDLRFITHTVCPHP
jgi:hypothetical protein